MAEDELKEVFLQRDPPRQASCDYGVGRIQGREAACLSRSQRRCRGAQKQVVLQWLCCVLTAELTGPGRVREGLQARVA